METKMRIPGEMEMPADFRYRKIHEMGRPRHAAYSAFAYRHPKMDTWRRAKLFAPFDALRGFDEAIASREAAAAADTFVIHEKADF